jgi:hypothetical protein
MIKLFSLLVASLILIIIALGSGAYNMAATEKHWGITEKIIEWVRESSVEARAKDLQVPQLDNAEMLLKGAEHYHAMCTACHLAPGMSPTELSAGLYPQAPVFYQREAINDQAEKQHLAKKYFWVIKNGLKMTAMPAWGLSHDDHSIWATTAFVLKMRKMTQEEYENFIHSAEDQEHHHDHNGHSH